MFEELSRIRLSGKDYPIKCDLYVLEKLQDEFGDIGEFEKKLVGLQEEKKKLPDLKAVNSGLYWMVREGLEIEAEEKGEQAKIPKKETIIRMVDEPFLIVANKLHTEFAKCLVSKNLQTTQGETEPNP